MRWKATLRATSGSWSGEGNAYSYQWLRFTGGAWVNIAGATGATYELVLADVGATVSVLVTATNPDGSGNRASAPSATVNAAPPVNTSVPFITGATLRGNTLTAAPGTWTGPGISYAYQWQRDGVDIPGATAATYRLDPTAAADNGAAFRVVVTNALGSATSAAAPLTVVVDEPPVPTILAPTAGVLYRAGGALRFKGAATDAEDGRLRPSAFSWRVDFHHDEHFHPFFPETAGRRAGRVRIPTTGETSANVWYRVHLNVTDSAGVSTTTFRDVRPRTVTLTITAPPGLPVNLDGQPATTPLTITSVVGLKRQLEAPPTQELNGETWTFVGWGRRRQPVLEFRTLARDRTYTARYEPAAPL